MFYETGKNNHGLRYNPFKSCVVPRPIGWISSVDSKGVVNLAPYSYFNAIADIPPMIMFASAKKEKSDIITEKDSLRNIENGGEFVVNIATYDMRDFVNLSSEELPYGVSEAETFRIEMAPSTLVKVPHVKNSSIHLECEYVRTVQLDFGEHKVSTKLVIGHVIGIRINDDLLVDGKIDITKLKPIARLGYDEYALIENIFKMKRP